MKFNFKHLAHTRYELLFSTGVSFTVRICGAFSAFALSLLVGQYLGATEAGYYFLSFAVVTFLATAGRFGLDNTVLRFVGAGFGSENVSFVSVIYKALLVTAIGAFSLSVLLYFSSSYLADVVFGKPELAAVLRPMSVSIVFFALFTLLAMALQGVRRIPASVFILNIAVNLLLVASVFFLGLDLAIDVAFWFSVNCALTFLFAVFLSRKILFKKLDTIAEEVSWPVLWASCMPLWIVALMSLTTQWSGQFIAGAYVEPAELAQLAVAQRTAMLTSFILMAVNMVVAPRFAAMYKQDDLVGLERLAITSVKLMLITALPIIGVMLLFPEFLMSLFGEGFAEGALLLQILAIGQFINVATGSVGYLLSMSGHEKDLRNTVLFSGPIALVAGFLLVPYYGALGSAIATALAIALQNLVAVFWVNKRLGFNTLAIWRRD